LRGKRAAVLWVVMGGVACASAGAVRGFQRSRLLVTPIEAVESMDEAPRLTFRFKVVAVESVAPAFRGAWQVGRTLEFSKGQGGAELLAFLQPGETTPSWPTQWSFGARRPLELEVVHVERHALGQDLGVWTLTNADRGSLSVDTAWP
jgi:hypothetical protein